MDKTGTPHVEHFFEEQWLEWPLTHFFGARRRSHLPVFVGAGFETPVGIVTRATTGLLAAVTLGILKH